MLLRSYIASNRENVLNGKQISHVVKLDLIVVETYVTNFMLSYVAFYKLYFGVTAHWIDEKSLQSNQSHMLQAPIWIAHLRCVGKRTGAKAF